MSHFDAVAVTALHKEAEALRDEVKRRGGTVEDWKGSQGVRGWQLLRVGPRKVLLATAPRMGNVYAAITTTKVVEALRRQEITAPTLVLLGITGANPNHTPKPALGDVVLATEVFEHDFGQKVEEKTDGTGSIQIRRHGYSVPIRAANDLQPHLNDVALESWLTRQVPKTKVVRGPYRKRVGRVLIGPVASREYVIKSVTELNEIVSAFPRTVAVEMEAVGVAHAVAELPGLRFVFMKGIVDFCNGRKNDAWHPAASRNAAALFVYLLTQGVL